MQNTTHYYIAFQLIANSIASYDECNDIDAKSCHLVIFEYDCPKRFQHTPDCRCYVLSRLTLLVFATLLLRPPITLGQQPSLTAKLVAENPSLRQGILLLRNGQLLGGQYTLTGFGYEVQLNGGGVIRLREEQVEFTSDSIDEVYLFQRASHVNSSASAHLKMANWCLANKLYEYADNHLKEAIRIDPREKGIIPIQSRLAIARSPQKATTPKTQIQQRPLASNETIAIRVNALEPSVIQSFVSQFSHFF